MDTDVSEFPSRLGRYEILGLIGSGAFADVVRAWDEALASHVAIKILNLSASQDELVRERFVEEGQLLRRVQHGNVLAVHDTGELDDGRPYLVVDLAEGGTLEDRIEPFEGTPIDADTVRRIVSALAAGLDAMHSAGVVHRDIKPENLMIDLGQVVGDRSATISGQIDTVLNGGVFDIGERLLIGDLGLAKDLAGRGSAPSVIGGSARYQAPEQLRADGVLGPPTDLYAASSVLWQLLSGHMAPEPHDIADNLTRFRPGWQTFFERAMAMDPEHRFPTAQAWLASVLDQLEVEPLAVAADDLPMANTKASPYKGLASFQPEDADVFFGREDLVTELVRRLQTNRVLVVAGPSGSGKSSAVRAGLLPALRSGSIQGSDEWRYELFTPGATPFEELHYRLTRHIDGRPRHTAEELAADPKLARRLLDDATTVETGWLIYIDQFEELFTLPDQPDVAAAFIESLAAMADPTDSRLRLVLAVRADFYSRCAQLAWLANRITDNQVLVGPMSADNIRRAIEEPARRHGLRLEPGLVDTVVDEAGNSAGSLPLISHALVETWARREGNVLTLDGFNQAGGVGGAIAQSADVLFENIFDDSRQRAAKRLLLRLVMPGEGNADTRRRLPFAELERDSEPEIMTDVVDQFVSARLLAVDDNTVEIAHEALILGWPRLRDWIDGERENLRFRHRVGRAAGEWESSGRDPDLLWRGTPLATALDWAGDHRDSLDRLEQEFVDASETAQRETEDARARQVARSQRTRRLATMALAALSVFLIVALAVAVVALRRASTSTSVAQQQFANALGTSALGQSQSDPRQSLLLAMESQARSERTTVDARAAMIQARLAMTTPGVVPVGPPINTPGSFRVALKPDGTVAAVADRAGPIRFYDTITGEKIGNDLTTHTSGARALEITPDGNVLVSGSSDGFVYRWDIRDPADVPEPRVISQKEANAWAVAIHPDGQQVAVGNDNGTIELFDLNTAAPLETIDWKDGSGGVTALVFSPDGSQLLAGNRGGRIWGWDLDSGEPLWDPVLRPREGKPWEIVFNPDGTLFAAAGDGPATIHDAETGLALYEEGFDATKAIAFTSDGARLLGGRADGTVHSWVVDDPDTGQTQSAARHGDTVEHADLSADGSIYATVGDDKQLRIWQAEAVPVGFDYVGFDEGAWGAAFDAAGERLAVGDGTGRLHLIDLTTGERTVGSPDHGGQAIWDVAWDPDGRWLASIGGDGSVVLWDPTTVEPTSTLGFHQGQGRSITVSPDGRHLVSADRGNEVRQGASVNVWAVETASLREQLQPHEQGVLATAFSVDGSLLATADAQGTIRIWDGKEFTLGSEWETGSTIQALGFSPEGLLGAVDATRNLRVFDPNTGQQVGTTASGFETGGTGVGFSQDGLTAAVVSQSGKLYLIDWQQGVNLTTSAIDVHPLPGSESFELVVSLDGARFAVTSDGGFEQTDGAVWVSDILSTERACNEAALRLDPSIEADLFDGVTPVACSR